MRPEPAFEELSAYADGELTGRARQELEAHLDGCESCRRRLEALRSIVVAVKSLPQEKPPRAFSVPPQREQRRRLWALPDWPGSTWVTGAAAAAFAVLLVGSLLTGHQGGPGGASPASGAPHPQFGAEQAAPRVSGASKASGFANHASADGVSPVAVHLDVSTDSAAYTADSTLRVRVQIITTGGPGDGSLTLVLAKQGSGTALPAPLGTTIGNERKFDGAYPLRDLGLAGGGGQYELVGSWHVAGSDEVVLAQLPITIR